MSMAITTVLTQRTSRRIQMLSLLVGGAQAVAEHQVRRLELMAHLFDGLPADAGGIDGGQLGVDFM
jgi:hypothetical protein